MSQLGFHAQVAALLASWPLAAGAQSLAIESVPAYGTLGHVSGGVSGVDFASHHVAGFVYIEGSGWWTKPSFAQPTVDIDASGGFSVNVGTGGPASLDSRAVIFCVALLPESQAPDSASGAVRIPATLAPLAIDCHERYGRTIVFAGQVWAVKEAPLPVGPGSNVFSDRTEDVFVDAQGHLHLRVAFHDGQWWSTEVILLTGYGHATYLVQTLSELDDLDPNLTFGMFLWDPHGDEESVPGSPNREIDFEDSDWTDPSDPTTSQMVVQPYSSPGNLRRYTLPDLAADPALTRYFTWEPDAIEFVALQGHHTPSSHLPGDVIDAYTYLHSPPTSYVPTPGRARFRINLWMNNVETGGGGPPAPASQQPAEVIVTDVQVLPEPGSAASLAAGLVALLGLALRRRATSASVMRLTSLHLLAALCTLPVVPSQADELLLRDDFSGGALDSAIWQMPEGDGTFLGRTQLRPPSEPLEVFDGVLRLVLDTYNPTARVPGDSFWGSEIVTREVFERGFGLVFRARVRLGADTPPGLVGSLFSFVHHPVPGHRDEITFELLSNDLQAEKERVLTNVFDDDFFDAAGDFEFAEVPGLDLSEWIELEVRWLRDRIEFLVEGELVRTERKTVPDSAMPVRLNFWAPDAAFRAAFSESLQPVSSGVQNQRYHYEVDRVEILRLDPPTTACPPAPLTGCVQAEKARLELENRKTGAAVSWSARGLGEIDPQSLEPPQEAPMALCVYENGTTPVVGISFPVGTGWLLRRNGIGFKGSDRKLSLRGGPRSRAKLSSREVGALPIPLLDAAPVVAQLSDGAGTCWEALFTAAPVQNSSKRHLSTLRTPKTIHPRLAFKRVPPIGSFDDLVGRVKGLRGADAMVTAYVDVGSPGRPVWWGPKPTFARPGVPIVRSRFELDFTTGGIDHQARRIAVFVLPADDSPPRRTGNSSLPAELFDRALASEILER